MTQAPAKRALRPYQVDAIQALRTALREGHRCIMLMGATGFGKTTVASEMIANAVAKGKRAIFIADRQELVEQASGRLDEDGIHHGIIMADHWRFDPSAPVQVASIQTLARRTPPDFDLAIIDEAHVFYRAHAELMQKYSAIPFVGLSATPFTKGLGKHYSKMVVAATAADLIDQGYLVDARVYAPSEPDVAKIQIVRGDYHEGQLAMAADKPELVADIVKTWQQLGEQRQTLCFAVNVAHSKHIVAQFRAAGIAAEHIDAYIDTAERRDIIARFRRGEIRILSNVAILDKGFDVPECSCLIMARPTKSLMLYIQTCGRVLRTSPGKADAIILDHAGNTCRLGFITDPLPTQLDDGKKKTKEEQQQQQKEKEQLPKPCPKCHAVKPPKTHTCPACGFTPERIANVEYQKDGELKEIKKAKISTTDKEQLYAEMLGYAKMKGYKEGWAYHKVKEYVGTFPHRHVDPRPASPKTLAIIKHLNIRAAKSRAKKTGLEASSAWLAQQPAAGEARAH